LIDEIRAIVNIQSLPGADNAPVLERCELQLQKWRLIQKYFHSHPFPTKNGIKRSEQWREVVPYVRDIAEIEVLDWVLLQAEVASNIEKKIHDLRPRKNGPCHPLLLEYVNDKKRKALAVFKWAKAADEGDTATAETLTPAILDCHSIKGTGGTENL